MGAQVMHSNGEPKGAKTGSGHSALRRVKIRNYKSIGACDVELSPLTVLVGRNSSGKSNFLDAVRFVADSLQTSVDHAIKSRGGIDAVRRRSTGHPRNFAIALEMVLPEYQVGQYAFEIAAREQGGFVIRREVLRIKNHTDKLVDAYDVEEGIVKTASLNSMPPASSDRLYLVNAAGLPAFRVVYNALTSMGFYNLNPESMKELQSPDSGELLHRDGGNIASVIARLSADHSSSVMRIKEYLETIVPGIADVERVSLGPRETLQFRQKVFGSPHPWKFYAVSMSDGTLRALGTLVAVTQLAERRNRMTVVGIEEPETALHPAAASALMDALREACSHTQVLVTSHSPDLLDLVDPQVDGLLIAVSRQGDTHIAPVDEASQKAIRDHFYSPGELLRMDQLDPDEADINRQRQLSLFGEIEDEL